MVFTRNYECIHTHEEAVIVGALLEIFGYAHVYDMHSSLPEQMSNFRISRSPIVFKLGEAFERWVLRHSSKTIDICPYLGERVKKLNQNQRYLVIENVPVIDDRRVVELRKITALRHKLGMTDEVIILLYRHNGSLSGD